MTLSRTEAQRLAATDTSQADQAQLASVIDQLFPPPPNRQEAVRNVPVLLPDSDPSRTRPEAEQGDPQWAGPSLPHPSEATSDAEAAELQDGWDDGQHGIEPNTEEAQL